MSPPLWIAMISTSRSENIKFGIRHRMRSGKTLLNHTRFLGYAARCEGQARVCQMVYRGRKRTFIFISQRAWLLKSRNKLIPVKYCAAHTICHISSCINARAARRLCLMCNTSLQKLTGSSRNTIFVMKADSLEFYQQAVPENPRSQHD